MRMLFHAFSVCQSPPICHLKHMLCFFKIKCSVIRVAQLDCISCVWRMQKLLRVEDVYQWVNRTAYSIKSNSDTCNSELLIPTIYKEDNGQIMFRWLEKNEKWFTILEAWVDPTYFIRKVYLKRPYMILLLLKYLFILFWPFKSS